MRFKARVLDIETKEAPIVVLDDEVAAEMDLHPGDRVRVKYKGKEVIAVLDVGWEWEKGEVGMFLDTAHKLEVKGGEMVEVELADRPSSIKWILKKMRGKELKRWEIGELVRDIALNKLSRVELSAFVSACEIHGLSLNETLWLTLETYKSGRRLELSAYPILDKHSVGGLAGNRTSLILVPIIASMGFVIPKTSSRAITSPAGTADVMEVFAKVSFTIEELREIIRQTNACIAWGGTLELAKADEALLRVRYPLRLDPLGLVISSVLSKKLAVGATHVVIDIPVGKEAKVKNVKEGRKWRSAFLRVAKKVRMKLQAMLTDGSQPIGRGIGPALEARDALLVLSGNGPEDLKGKAIKLASALLRIAGIKNASEHANEQLRSGKALEKFREIIEAQGGDRDVGVEHIGVGKYVHEVRSKKGGVVKKVSNYAVINIARAAGAPKSKGAGIYLCKKVGERVEKGEKLFTIYAESKRRLKQAVELAEQLKAIEL